MIFALTALVLIALSVPPSLHEKSWKRFFIAMALSAAGVLLPLFIFVTSMFLVPDWKGGCSQGWVDCFHIGKLALTPLVLWACAAFYVVQILEPSPKLRVWVDLGLFMGMITSSICFLFGLLVHQFHNALSWWLLVPLYVSVWYSHLSIRAFKQSNLGIRPYLLTLVGSTPLWAISIIWSKKHYLSLPDDPPSCFIVTAAQRGHEGIVGPFSQVEHNDKTRIANQQIKTFWKLEEVWKYQHPRSHRIFRRLYNKIGPVIANHVRSRYIADIVYLLLKPLEVTANILINLHQTRVRRTTRPRP